MALTLNSNAVTSNKLNGTDVSIETLNGTTVYQAGATKWTYYSALIAYDITADMGQSTFCPTQEAAAQYLTDNYPPSNYEVGTYARVISRTRFGDCEAFHYTAE